MSMSQKLLIVASAAATLAVASTTSNAQSSLSRAGVTIPADVKGPTVADAKRYAEEGKLKDAESAYRAVIERQQANREYPVEAMKGLAFLQYARNNDYGAAITLEELAASAAEFGDPQTQLTALFNSSLLFQQLGDKKRASSHVAKIKALLQSPVIPADVRDGIASRIS